MYTLDGEIVAARVSHARVTHQMQEGLLLHKMLRFLHKNRQILHKNIHSCIQNLWRCISQDVCSFQGVGELCVRESENACAVAALYQILHKTLPFLHKKHRILHKNLHSCIKNLWRCIFGKICKNREPRAEPENARASASFSNCTKSFHSCIKHFHSCIKTSVPA